LAAVVSITLLLSACGAPKDDDTAGNTTPPAASSQSQEPEAGGTLTVGWNQPLYSLNHLSSNGNNATNGIVTYLTRARWGFYNENLEWNWNKDFGEATVQSEDPLVIKQTINEAATWSDGTPLSAADQVLEWAAESGQFTAAGEDGEEANIFDAGAPGVALIEETPEVDANGRDVTYTYTKPFSDWQYSFTEVGVPSHVVAKHALGIEDPAEGQAAILKAIQDRDLESLKKIAAVWNTGFDFDSLPTGDDADLTVSSGPFTLDAFVEGQYVTLHPRPDFTWGPKAKIDELIISYDEDPLAQVQALQNGELDLIAPQVTPDVLAAVQDSPGLDYFQAIEGTYEHVDLTLNNGGPFDPAAYGGDEAKAIKVRQAFLKTIPRQQIVDTLIKPLQDDAQIRNSFNVVPGAPGYDEVAAANGMTAYNEVDIDGAKALLEEAGVAAPVDVRLLYAKSNTRRVQEYQLIFESAAKAGFNVVDNGDEKWSSRMGDGSYDASLFGWQSTSTAINEPAANYVVNGQNNFGGLNNPDVDNLYSELQVALDQASQQRINQDVEKLLVDLGFGLTIFQFPGLVAWNTERISGVSTIAINPTIFYNYWDWESLS
jgi:peptide/nickel transport system substrate-binding protein